MNILFTGVTSFTGYWFADELIRNGHELHVTLQGSVDSYTGLKRFRLNKIAKSCRTLENTKFGDDNFIEQIHQNEFDLLCHHGAYVTDYKSDNFSVDSALRSNTNNIREVVSSLAETGCCNIVLTGSVFESDEGLGSENLRAFSPYGLSKSLTSTVFKYWTQKYNLKCKKFVIPNPFGPLEEFRFTSYLASCWLANKKAVVNTPNYIRDNIHVSLLAKEYYQTAIDDPFIEEFSVYGPSGYICSQGKFAEMMAREMRSRLRLPCELELGEQLEFKEPRVRINKDFPDPEKYGWEEHSAWDSLAKFYQSEFFLK